MNTSRARYLRRLRRLASRALRFFSSCLFSKNLRRLHSWMTPALDTSRRNLRRSTSSGSPSSTIICTLYAELKNMRLARAKAGFTTDSTVAAAASRRGRDDRGRRLFVMAEEEEMRGRWREGREERCGNAIDAAISRWEEEDMTVAQSLKSLSTSLQQRRTSSKGMDIKEWKKGWKEPTRRFGPLLILSHFPHNAITIDRAKNVLSKYPQSTLLK